MAFGVVLVDFAFFLGGDGFVGAVAEGLVLGEAAHANPDGFFLGLDFERAEIGFQDFAHERIVMGTRGGRQRPFCGRCAAEGPA